MGYSYYANHYTKSDELRDGEPHCEDVQPVATVNWLKLWAWLIAIVTSLSFFYLLIHVFSALT